MIGQSAPTPATLTKSRRAAAKGGAVEEMIQTSFRLPRSRWAKLQQLSIDRRASVQSIIVGALEAEFARQGLSF